MNGLRRLAGWLWLVTGPAVLGFLLWQGWVKISAHPTQDVYLPWVIIVLIFTPIAAGLCLFGWYAVKGEYDN